MKKHQNDPGCSMNMIIIIPNTYQLNQSIIICLYTYKHFKSIEIFINNSCLFRKDSSVKCLLHITDESEGANSFLVSLTKPVHA